MFLIVGLGNPGKEYDGTRHNIGFAAVDYIADKYNIELNRIKFKGVFGEGFIEGKKVILLKPTTYMNLSGESIREVINFYKISNEEVIVIYDDISLEVGRLRIREKGSHGGHNGIKSIIANLGTDVFPRVKIGVGAPKGNLVSHVLGKFSEDEIEVLRETIKASSDAVSIIMKADIKEAMNKLNGFNACKES
ncbi:MULTISPECIES: aminoacyl-tRNA hydrolase [unclassified Clostridium]|mgnify:CR=1 FL=1|jgi:PTH1 family peptidyl-tRNA hydrolase|uniref:aminoacyl-tRNA hydrolase n=1 Tax=Clostridium TaxID=1485 RepID=UPI001C8CB499|nr:MULTISPECIES: aminoacyl-tRNA hydrolase [unclassified Clostridium]MBX9137317.1 aminoacyl-tRNA hydrolase [Clostridium sp. K12(2020)]MBX9144128.1 aminoacyl-tRNA hydrolase [Clostridium sp. K13]MDU2291452.1 aminoacyl-tRNA hydrolase [Clostridium celatum]MDU4324707.1 aminoacyl-tRNA hydrolase [Clostridium celatum]